MRGIPGTGPQLLKRLGLTVGTGFCFEGVCNSRVNCKNVELLQKPIQVWFYVISNQSLIFPSSHPE